MSKIKELEEKLINAMEVLKDFGKLKHLFSKDDGEKTLAKLYQDIGSVLFYVKITQLKEIGHPKNKPLKSGFISGEPGLVSVRPCGDEYKNKTYVGFYIGDAALSSSVSIEDDKITCDFAHYNPAIFIPELNKIVYGCESWWGKIKSIDDFKKISDKNIEDVWYVKMFKSMNNKEEKL